MNNTRTQSQMKHLRTLYPTKATAVVDAIHDDKIDICSYSVTIRIGEDVYVLSESFIPSRSSQALAEIKGAEHTMRFCLENNVNSLDLLYNYEGINTYSTGSRRTKDPILRAYSAFYNSIKDNLTVNFIKNTQTS